MIIYELVFWCGEHMLRGCWEFEGRGDCPSMEIGTVGPIWQVFNAVCSRKVLADALVGEMPSDSIDQIQTYQFKVVLFGAVCSPFMLKALLKQFNTTIMLDPL